MSVAAIACPRTKAWRVLSGQVDLADLTPGDKAAYLRCLKRGVGFHEAFGARLAALQYRLNALHPDERMAVFAETYPPDTRDRLTRQDEALQCLTSREQEIMDKITAWNGMLRCPKAKSFWIEWSAFE